MRFSTLLISLSSLALLSSCADRSPTESSRSHSRPAAQTQYWCETHPVECHGENPENPPPADPDTASRGYWLGTTVTSATCFSRDGMGINDADHDGLSDYCEQKLADVFKPVFTLGPANYECDSDMEPYWAAKYFPDQGNVVRIFYALAYYRDCGSSNPGGGALQFVGRVFTLNGLLPAYHLGPVPISTANESDGHSGDSEFLVEEVSYDAVTQHWALTKVFYSAHFKTDADGSSIAFTNGKPIVLQVEPGDGHLAGYPRVWVMYGKHANYPSRSRCSAGRGFAGSVHDNCNVNGRDVRLVFSSNHNLGSAAHNFINQESCVRSELQPAFKPGLECFWRPGAYFYGWLQYPYGAPPTPYYSELLMKFECFSDFGYSGGPPPTGEQFQCSDWGVNW